MAFSGDALVVGAYDGPVSSPDSYGEVYLFDASDGYNFMTVLAPNEYSGLSDYFGYAVAATDGFVFVGAHQTDDSGVNNAGVVYVFEQSGASWSQIDVLRASDAGAFDNFGYRVAASDDVVAVANIDSPTTDRAYVFEYYHAPTTAPVSWAPTGSAAPTTPAPTYAPSTRPSAGRAGIKLPGSVARCQRNYRTKRAQC